MDDTEAAHLERRINREITARFPAGSVRRVALVRDHEDPALEPGELLVRVFAAPGGQAGETGQAGEDPQRVLDDWARAHEVGMRRLRRELSLRLPPARLLEFTVEAPGGDGKAGAGAGGAAVPRITLPDDPALTAEPLPAAEVVDIVAGLIRSSYVFPDRAGQAAAALGASLAAGEYDGLDDEELAEKLTSQLYEVCRDKHLRVRTRPPWDAARERDRPGRDRPGRGAGPRPPSPRRCRPDRACWPGRRPAASCA